MRKYYVFILPLMIVITSCQESNLAQLIESEKLEIRERIEGVLTELGFTSFSIHMHYHRTLNNRVRSKAVSTTRIFGEMIPVSALTPFQPINVDIVEQENIYNGHIEHRTMQVNYDELMEGLMFYEYISTVILIENIEQGRINELLMLFNNFIVNHNRGDTIHILSK